MKTGHIRIVDNKVYFEPDGLEKPKWLDYNEIGIQPKYRKNYKFKKGTYNQALKEYEASKQLVELCCVVTLKEEKHIYIRENQDKGNWVIIKNNQSCKAEIKDNNATIIKLIKE